MTFPRFPVAGAGRVARVILAAWLVLGLGGLAYRPIAAIWSGDEVLSAVPRFRWILMPRAWVTGVDSSAGQLRAVGDPRLLILSPDAGFYYLVSGIQDPTPFDYPLVTAFGSHGESEVIDELARGKINAVCLNAGAGGSLDPTRLENYVQRSLRAGPSLGFCRLYFTRAE